MGCSDRHVAMVVGQHDVAPMISLLALKSDAPALLSGVPANAFGVIVDLVGRAIDATKIAQAVIRAIAVDVIDLLGLFAVGKKPRNTMNKQGAAFVRHTQISTCVNCANRPDFAAAHRLYPANDSSFRVIAKAFTDRIRNNFVSHAESPLSVVRGVGSWRYRYPDLTIFTASGGKSRGTYGPTPCLTIRQPL